MTIGHYDMPLKHMALIELSPTRRIAIVKRADYNNPPVWEGSIVDIGAPGRLTMEQAAAFNAGFQKALEIAAKYDELYPAGSPATEAHP